MDNVINFKKCLAKKSIWFLLHTSPMKILTDEFPDPAIRKSTNGVILKKFLELIYQYFDGMMEKVYFENGVSWKKTVPELQRYVNWLDKNEEVNGVNTFEEVMRVIRKYVPWILEE